MAIYLLYKYAPGDTEQKPLLNKYTREKNKKVSCFIGVTYVIIGFITSDEIISNILLLVLVLECVMINPITYKFLKRRYNNYEYY